MMGRIDARFGGMTGGWGRLAAADRI